jgi:hypothetical protein
MTMGASFSKKMFKLNQKKRGVYGGKRGMCDSNTLWRQRQSGMKTCGIRYKKIEDSKDGENFAR